MSRLKMFHVKHHDSDVGAKTLALVKMETTKYQQSLNKGLDTIKVRQALEMAESCTLCPRECRVDRGAGDRGYCGAGHEIAVSSANEHHGEEPPISGNRGSGTIFLGHCNLKCVFCQNYPISHLGNSTEISCENLAKKVLLLQKRGCHNINFVTPTHYMPQIVQSIFIAAKEGLKIPIVYNCGGYESLQALEILDGVVDIYMPDIKYHSSELSKKYSGAADYFEKTSKAVLEMYRQVGELKVNADGIAESGLLIRHLVMPSAVEDTKKILRFIAEKISKRTYISLMAQYFPAYRAGEYPEIARRLTPEEYEEAVDAAEELGLDRGWIQGEFLQRL